MNELVTMDAARQRELNAILGASSDEGPTRLSILKVNSKRKDADGKKIPEGHFVLTGMDDPVYAEKVKIRPLSHTFQWMHFDSEAKKLVNKTLIVPNFRVEPIDMKGTLRCGKPASKVFRELSKDDQKKYEDIKCYRQVRCLVTYTGKTADGVEVTVENHPAVLMLKGSNFSPFEDEVIKRLPQGRNLYDYWVDLSTTEHENGSVTYFVIKFEPDLGNPVPLDKPTMDSMYVIADMISEENAGVKRKHQESMYNRNRDDDALDALDGILDDFEEDAA
jgi:hypothetical protein